MYLLVVILLTANGMEMPAVFRLPNEAECLKALPVAQEVAEKHSKHGYIAACLRVAGADI